MMDASACMAETMDKRNKFKVSHGVDRLRRAIRYSVAGWQAAWHDEAAFRQVAFMAAVGVPLACWLGHSWEATILLLLPLVLSLVVELLNSALENTVDRISLEEHPLAKKAKDMGSAAQFTAQLFLAVVWGSYLWHLYISAL